MAALTVGPPWNNFKHFCKICNKGFMCGRALGGHMRAHGINDVDSLSIDDVEMDPTSDDEEDKEMNGNNKRNYELRTNSNRPRSCRACENCGKEFLSWKLFLEHGKCGGSDPDTSLVSSPSSEFDVEDEDVGSGSRGGGWSKRKRSHRAKIQPLSEEEDLANCLMMLSNSVVVDQPTFDFVAAPPVTRPVVEKGKGLFECKACKKVFNSHQALGGHRASHKKVKGCFAARLDHVDDSHNNANPNIVLVDDVDDDKSLEGASSSTMASKRKMITSKVHECSICHRVFSSGQALGGHKRCHWMTPAPPRFHHQSDDQKPLDLNHNVLSLKVSTDFFLQSWRGGAVDDVPEKHEEEEENTKNNSFESPQLNVDDEADSKVKLAKLSELRDNNMPAGSSPWLQVGIGSNNGVEAHP